jgi:hypothetical protein
MRIGHGMNPLLREPYQKVNCACRYIVDNVYNEIFIPAKDSYMMILKCKQANASLSLSFNQWTTGIKAPHVNLCIRR